MDYLTLSFQNWKKFGNSEFDAPGPNVATTTVSDDVFMTFISSKEVGPLVWIKDFTAAYHWLNGCWYELFLPFTGLECPRSG